MAEENENKTVSGTTTGQNAGDAAAGTKTSVASKLVSLGDDFIVQAKDGNDEVRFRNEKTVSSALSRLKGANRNFKLGQRCEILVRIVEEAPEPATVTVEMRAEDVGSLPNDAVIKKSEPPPAQP